MRAAIFTEGSSTTSDSTESYVEFFEGTFLPVKSLVDEMSQYCDTELHILSEKHGYVRGENEVKLDLSPNESVETEQFINSLLSNIDKYDIVLLLFTTDIFTDIITDNWGEIVRNAKEDSIWCIGTSRGAMNSVDLDALQRDHSVLIYQRRGVAPLGTETKEELLGYIRTREND